MGFDWKTISVSIVSLCFTIVAFICDAVAVHPNPTDADGILFAGAACGIAQFILVWFVERGNKFENTYSYFCSGAAICNIVFFIWGADDYNTAASAVGSTFSAPLVLTAIVFAAANSVLLILLTYWSLEDNFAKLNAKTHKTNFCLISLALTIISFVIWITEYENANNEWHHGIFIAGVGTALLAVMSGLFAKSGSDDMFFFNSFAAVVFLATFAIGRAVDGAAGNGTKDLVVVILSFVNTVVVGLMVKEGLGADNKRTDFLGGLIEKLAFIVFLLSIIIFALERGIAQAVGMNWHQKILTCASATVWVSTFFKFIHVDAIAMHVNQFISAVLYVVYFIAGCILNAASTATATTMQENIAITALVFTVVNIVLLAIIIKKTCPFECKVAPKPADDVEAAEEE
jgi:hypothetical protein